MKISTKGRYALRMMLDLAVHRSDGFIALKDIADRQNISKKYLEQIVPLLNKADLLRTNRGYQGGYALSKNPDQYTVGEILRELPPVSRKRVSARLRVYNPARVGGTLQGDKQLPRQRYPAGYH